MDLLFIRYETYHSNEVKLLKRQKGKGLNLCITPMIMYTIMLFHFCPSITFPHAYREGGWGWISSGSRTPRAFFSLSGSPWGSNLCNFFSVYQQGPPLCSAHQHIVVVIDYTAHSGSACMNHCCFTVSGYWTGRGAEGVASTTSWECCTRWRGTTLNTVYIT